MCKIVREKTQLTIELNGVKYLFIRKSKKIWVLCHQGGMTIELKHPQFNNQSITIPEGFLTDFNSALTRKRAGIPNFGIYYLIHDYLYQHQSLPIWPDQASAKNRNLADQEQKLWMEQCGLGKLKIKIIDSAVHLFGNKYWKYYQKGGTFPPSKKKLKRIKAGK